MVLILHFTISKYYTITQKGIHEESHQYAAEKLHEAFRKNLGAYIKLGQVISHMASIIPDAYVEELEPLCSECPTSSIDEIKRTLRRELGKDPDLIFKEIEAEPIGSASLAQVHRAVLLDGTKVAIKVFDY